MTEGNIDFIGIGTQKSGTSWLHYQLDRIPEFDLPPIKEMHYFDRSSKYPSHNQLNTSSALKRLFNIKYTLYVAKTIFPYLKINKIDTLNFYLKWFFSNYSDEWYLSLFKNFDGYTGEISPSYSILEEDEIKQMYNLAPKAKLVLLLRNPIERAWSHYRFVQKKSSKLNKEEVSKKNVIDFIESKSQLLRSDYIRTINNFIKVYPKKQILIGFYDAIEENPNALLNDIIKFICGDQPVNKSNLKLKKVVNQSKKLDCPESIENYLKNKYYKQIKQLAEKYGGYFVKWFEETYNEKSSNSNSKLSSTIYLEP